MKRNLIVKRIFAALLISGVGFFAACSSETKSTDSRSGSGDGASKVREIASSSKPDSLGKKGEKGDKREKDLERKPGARPAVPVKVATLGTGDISSSLVFDSVLETESSVEIYSESQGVILEVLVEVGDRVEKGDVLARLESEEQQLDMEENKTRYEQEKLSFERSKELAERKLINQQEFERATFNLEQARLRHERSKIRLENTIVRATVEGVVTERIAQVGRRVTANRQLFALMNLDELYAEVNAPGQHLLRISQGLTAEIESDLIEGVSYPAYVQLVSPVVDPASGTFKVKVAVKNDQGLPIYPGMFVNVRVIVDTRRDVVLVPKEAIVHEGDLQYVFRVRNGRAQKIQFVEGYSSLKLVESTHGFAKGDEVIVLGQSALKSGALVKVITEGIAAESVSDSDVSQTEG